ncbi:TrbI/VirB10 family protein [Dickeya dadantii]|uniref:TrbI/VirB10 family protein n=1 Tax=Dickeya dadantii TaxID=204038 RepID=UPI00149592E3|nr:TrbI/VirB10 family protein [Dickeya dadantii]NPE55587.1 TrbI/VirB10 family protein [Dickeya dadantii]NPE68979.1 TrbI/VirB10 family protein [Dickeya dadantii]
MSKEIDPIDEYDNEVENFKDNADRKSVKGKGARIIGAILLMFAILVAGSGFLYKKFFQEKDSSASKAASDLKSAFGLQGRKFGEPPVSGDTDNDKNKKSDDPPAPEDKLKQNGKDHKADVAPDQQLDEKGRTPQQAARARKLAGSIGSGNQDSTSSSSQDSSDSNAKVSTDKDNGLDSSLNRVATVTVKPYRKRGMDLILTRGNSMPCALERAIDSTVSGQIVCNLVTDVFSSTGKVLLLERGTKAIGNYRGGLSQGQARIEATWDRLETPNGVFIDIRSPAIGPMGQAGIDGEIDTQFWKRFGNTILLSTIQDTISASSTHLANSSGQNNNSISLNNTTQATSNVAEETLKNSINIPAILRKNQGEIIGIDVMQDMDFSSVYSIERIK